MASHDDYGKQILRAVAGDDYGLYGSAVEVDYGAGQPTRIDGGTRLRLDKGNQYFRGRIDVASTGQIVTQSPHPRHASALYSICSSS